MSGENLGAELHSTQSSVTVRVKAALCGLKKKLNLTIIILTILKVNTNWTLLEARKVAGSATRKLFKQYKLCFHDWRNKLTFKTFYLFLCGGPRHLSVFKQSCGTFILLWEHLVYSLTLNFFYKKHTAPLKIYSSAAVTYSFKFFYFKLYLREKQSLFRHYSDDSFSSDNTLHTKTWKVITKCYWHINASVLYSNLLILKNWHSGAI